MTKRWMSMRGTAALGVVVALVAAALTVPTAGKAQAAPGPVDAGIFVDKVDGLPEDFINGVDVSSYLSLIESGVVFRDAAGEEANLFDVLADAGITYVRVRVWNDPFDAAGHGFGGGNLDADRATQLAALATASGLRVLVDFHYSDFWAHPGQQQSPRAWEGMDLAQRADALYDYTADVLAQMDAAGVDVGMVQVGNETNFSATQMIGGVGGWPNATALFQAGSQAVRDTLGPDVLVALHFTNPESQDYVWYAQQLADAGVDYDVFATSWYPVWHGSTTNLTAKLKAVADTFDKKVMVAEVAWSYTLEDGDGHENTIRPGTEGTQYATSVQGQANAIRDAINAVVQVGEAGIGVFYWEPAWLPVGPASQASANAVLWERDGSGWATSYAGVYSEDAGRYFGGSAVDNQALFAFDGTPLESLWTFAYARTGAVGPREVDSVASPTVAVTYPNPVVMPATVTVTYTDSSTEDEAVTWSDAVAWITTPGTFTVTGTTASGKAATATVVVSMPNLLHNGGFEDGGAFWTPWSDPAAATFASVDSSGNVREGTHGWNYYDASGTDFSLTQAVSDVPAGTYVLSGWAHGLDVSPALSMWSDATGTLSDSFTLTGWTQWSHAEVEFTLAEDADVSVWIGGSGAAEGWAWFDDLRLERRMDAGAVDLTALQALVTRANAMDRDVYSEDSVADLDAALEKARIVLASAAPTQAMADDAAQLLRTALDALVIVGEVPDPVVTPVNVTVTDGDPVTPPAQVEVTFFDGRTAMQDVTWPASLAYIAGPGTYTFSGVTAEGWSAPLTVTVTARQWILNPSFEDPDMSMWAITGTGVSVGSANASQGTHALAFWDGAPYQFSVSQTVTGLPVGEYVAGVKAVGEIDPGSTLTLTVSSGESDVAAPVELRPWADPLVHGVTAAGPVSQDEAGGSVVVTLAGTLAADDWGALDEVTLVRVPGAAADTTALDAAVAAAQGLTQALYTPGSWAALQDALAGVPVVLGASTPTQQSVDALAADIRDAMDALAFVGSEQVVLSALTVTAGDAVSVEVRNVSLDAVEVGVASTYQALASLPLVEGRGSVTVTLPATLEAGVHHIQVRDASGALLLEQEIQVRGLGGLLGNTGVEPAGALAASALLLLTGAGLVLARRSLSAAGGASARGRARSGH